MAVPYMTTRAVQRFKNIQIQAITHSLKSQDNWLNNQGKSYCIGNDVSPCKPKYFKCK